MSFLQTIKERAKSSIKTIVLPESYDIRTLEATQTVLKEGLANLILIGDESKIAQDAKDLDIADATVVNPATFDKIDEYANALYELRKSKGMTLEQAKELLIKDSLFLGVMMVKMGLADGMVAGAANATAAVLRPSLQILKTAPNTKIVSGFFLMVVPDCEYGADGVFVFGDCGLNQSPNSEELAAIAQSSAKSFKQLTGKEPIIAMLSHSTHGSAKHAEVDKMVEATRLAKELEPNLKIEGELQADAAIVPAIGKFKAPDSKYAGEANVLVFPDLDAGNIAYKLVQRLAKAEAYGPLTQGIAKPVNDLSRGCSSDDIVGVIAVTAVQAQEV
ncbi:MAG: phosphotransacetylase [Epulopiscium sp. Nele67-Bin002]|nr:MAG: phosphate acetyltransferase [Epulopiscium sp. Nuni2H_MBin001]OON91931.1 MAG: phosphotransacetylase [Epulopiscium sp. Nele67-Bin002]